VDGTLDQHEIRWSPKACVCVVMASGGYPEKYDKGIEITGLDDASAMEGVVVFHAGTKLSDGKVVTNGGRVLGVTAMADDLAAARDLAYAAVEKIHFDKAHVRSDIAAKAFS